MNKTKILTVFLALVALAAGLVVQQAMRTSVKIEDTVTPLDFSFPDTSDKAQAIGQWRGKVLVINFWATWCPPCLTEISEFIKLQAEYQGKGLQFVGIAIEDKQPVLDYLKDINVNYPVLIAGDAGIALTQQLGNVISAVPFTVVVDRAGRIVFRQPGELTPAKLREVLVPLLSAK
ncbi:MAG: TlpA family protein disulfide reductase [Methylococcaceae bacterium]|nr:TlpA family protein disulfide reductase [Methylococcaceae bacterium]